jgi:hypothetical protein
MLRRTRSILSKAEPRHLLLAPHGVRKTSKPTSQVFSVQNSAQVDRVSVHSLADNTAVPATTPTRPRTPLSEQSFQQLSSADSKASDVHPSDAGKGSPTPSEREKLGPFKDYINRAEKYLDIYITQPKKRIKGLLRRQAKENPNRLAEFHAGLLEREAEFQARAKKIDHFALQDHALQEGLISAPPSHASSTADIRDRMRVTTLLDDSQTLDPLSEEGPRKRGHQASLSESQELQLRAKRSALACMLKE